MTSTDVHVPTETTTNMSSAHADREQDDGVVLFLDQQQRLFSIAARIVGDTTAAEDVVQEVWVRWQRTDRSEVRNPPAFLATATTRVAINVLQSAHHRRETSVTPWLEDMTDGANGAPPGDPAANAEAVEAAEHAISVLMERLGPAERGAYVLRKAFDYSYMRIAEVLPVSAVHARQLVRRAQLKLPSAAPRQVDAREQRRLVDAFLRAAQRGEFRSLEALLVSHIQVPTTVADSGRALRRLTA